MHILKGIAVFINKIHTWISLVFLYGGILLMIFMTLGVLVQVLMRYVIGHPISWIEEFCVYAMFVMSFVLVPYLFLHRLNISMTLFYDKINNLKLKLLVDSILNIMIIVSTAILLPSLFDIVSSNLAVANAQIFLSKGQVFLVVPIAFVLIITITVDNIIRDISDIVKGKSRNIDNQMDEEKAL